MTDVPAELAAGAIEQMGAEVSILDAQGRIRYVNEEWRIFSAANGGASGDYIGASYRDLLAPQGAALAPADAELLRVIDNKQPTARINYICDAPGVRRHFVLHARNVHVAGTRWVVLVHALNSTREIGVRLGHADEEPGLQSLRERLVRLVSHQLRTPLTPIRVDVKLLHKALHDSEYAQTIDRLERNIRRLDQLVARGVDLARLESEASFTLQKRPGMTSVWQAAVYAVKQEAFDQPVEVRREGEDRTIPVDLAWLGRAVREIVANAVQFGKPPFDISVTGMDDGVELAVKDSGRGPDDEIQTAFMPFVRGERDVGLGTGLGLGLTIVRRVAEAHGGSAGFEVTDEGTTFTLRISSSPPVAPASRPQRPIRTKTETTTARRVSSEPV